MRLVGEVTSMTIVHITTDYPDAWRPDKTRAIANLVETTRSDFDHRVYSLNRVGISAGDAAGRWLSGRLAEGLTLVERTDMLTTYRYEAPAKGVFLKSSLEAVADALAEDIADQAITPSMIQGHKLSMEGIIAARLAARFGVPYALCVQGNTDCTILNIRRDLRGTYKQIFHNAAMVFPFTPWSLDYCEKLLGKRHGPVQLLPCITQQDSILMPQDTPAQAMSAFHLRHWQIKNLPVLLTASAAVEQHVDGYGLTIYGGGDPVLVQVLQQKIDKCEAENIHLGGPLSAQNIQQVMNRHAAFVMPSKRESFGMVFIEALLAGCPIVYPQGSAVDGYFDDRSFAIGVPANDAQAIARATTELLLHQQSVKQDLGHWQKSPDARQFQHDTITKTYREGLNLVLAACSGAAA